MINLYALTQDELHQLLRDWGYTAFRARQVWEWMYSKRVASFEAMYTVPRDLRQRLHETCSLGTMTVAAEQSSHDGTTKRLYRLADGQLIESVLMPYDDDRRTACISSQVGCAMGCVFCATGQMGFARQLSSAEIFEQVMHFACKLEAQGERLSNVVLMGMGEPFHNYDNVLHAVRRLMSDLGIGARHITISTVGLAPQIRRFADEGLQVKLAISLHKATNAARSALLPINKRWPLEELMDACHDYVNKTGRRISFEWAAISGQNDSLLEAHQLGALLRGLLCHVNIIPLNPTSDYAGQPSDARAIQQFIATLAEYGVSATVRVRRGIDIDAGCGQLKSKIIRLDSISSQRPTE